MKADSREVCRLWARRLLDRAENYKRTLYFQDDAIYSYGPHFPMARHVSCGEGVAVLFTTHGYSVTTKKHKTFVSYALFNVVQVVFCVPELYPERDAHKANLECIKRRVEVAAASEILRGQGSKWEVTRALGEANSYCEFFGLPSRIAVGELVVEAPVEAEATPPYRPRLSGRRRRIRTVEGGYD